MPLTNCEINLVLTQSANYVLSNATNAIFAITDTSPYVLTHDNGKPFQQLKLGFKGAINWNIYQPKVTTQVVNQDLDYLIDPSFQGLKRPFAILFENINNGIGYTE